MEKEQMRLGRREVRKKIYMLFVGKARAGEMDVYDEVHLRRLMEEEILGIGEYSEQPWKSPLTEIFVETEEINSWEMSKKKMKNLSVLGDAIGWERMREDNKDLSDIGVFMSGEKTGEKTRYCLYFDTNFEGKGLLEILNQLSPVKNANIAGVVDDWWLVEGSRNIDLARMHGLRLAEKTDSPFHMAMQEFEAGHRRQWLRSLLIDGYSREEKTEIVQLSGRLTEVVPVVIWERDNRGIRKLKFPRDEGYYNWSSLLGALILSQFVEMGWPERMGARGTGAKQEMGAAQVGPLLLMTQEKLAKSGILEELEESCRKSS